MKVFPINTSSAYKKLKDSINTNPIYHLAKVVEDVELVIHLGAHLGQELELYKSYGFKKIFWIEANPIVFAELEKRVGRSNCCNALLYAVCEKSLSFNISSNELSSSIYEFNPNYKDLYLSMQSRSLMSTRTLDCCLHDKTWRNDPKILVLDLQGAEFDALLGSKLALRSSRAAIIEVSKQKMYLADSGFQEILSFMGAHGFKMLFDTTDIHDGHGDMVFIRKDVQIKISQLMKLKLLRLKRYAVWLLEILSRRNIVHVEVL